MAQGGNGRDIGSRKERGIMMEGIFSALFMIFLMVCLFGVPVLLTLFHVVLLFKRNYGPKVKAWRNWIEMFTIFLGSVYSLGFLAVSGICMNADWPMQLVNSEKHTPVATWTWPTIITLACVGIAGYLILRLVPLKCMPPLVVVTGISFVYVGILVSVLWCVQICGEESSWLMLFPINCILLALIRIKDLIFQWRELQESERKSFRNPFLQRCNDKLMNAGTWPVAACVLFLPILGALIGILVLFGQSSDAIIQAFTQTSDWNLSTQVSPQNVFQDEHYLCTVAAGGHRKVVKPVRMGVRHGHPVIVNRQLCIANAFEQILEERVPRAHRVIRNFYDTYGFPIAKLIHSPYLADMVYFMMKPLEWLFLMVIYFCDVKPENRIAVQYLPAAAQKLIKKEQ